MPCLVIYLEATICVEGHLTPKNHPCFYGIILILWKKSLAQSFVQSFISPYEVMKL